MLVCFCKNKEDFQQAETINEKGEVVGGLVDAKYEFTRPLSCLELTGGFWRCISHWEQVGDDYYCEHTKYWELDEEHYIVSPFEVKHECILCQFSREKDVKFNDAVKHWHLLHWSEDIDLGRLCSVDRSFLKENPPGELIDIQWECKTLHIKELRSLFIPDNWVHNWCDPEPEWSRWYA